MGSLHSIQLSKIAQRGIILFVEGDDRIYLSDVAYKMGGKTFDDFSTIAVQELKGKGNAPSAMGTAQALHKASNGDLSTVLLLDSDYMLSEQRAAFQDKAKSSKLIAKIWHRKEIENYFIHPGAITRLITSRTEGVSPTEEQIEGIINEIISSMIIDLKLSFSDVIQKATRPRVEPKTAFKRAELEINSRLERGSSYLDMIDGKDFISKLSGVTKSKFGVSISPLAICKEMKCEEYDEEIKDFIRQICVPEQLTTDSFAGPAATPKIAA
jgi:hypothetical protein